MAVDNKTIGRFILDGIPPAPRGLPQIEVTFDIDANGILNVAAKDHATGKGQNIRIEASSGLSEAEIEKMVADAKVHEAEDRVRREEISTRNDADAAVFQSEKQLKEFGDKLSDDSKSKIETAAARVKTALESDNTDEIKSAAEALNQLWQEASTEMYKQAETQQAGAQQPGADPTNGNGSPGSDHDGDAQDAEFEEVK
jgi:molecular chaperone DnaK